MATAASTQSNSQTQRQPSTAPSRSQATVAHGTRQATFVEVAPPLVGNADVHSLATDNVVLDNVELADYMQVLARVNPAAADGAADFMRAFLAKCGRTMRTLELRQAVADGAGDPVLMQMIRAAYEHDATTSVRLASQVDCSRFGVGKRDHGGGR